MTWALDGKIEGYGRVLAGAACTTWPAWRPRRRGRLCAPGDAGEEWFRLFRGHFKGGIEGETA